MREKKEASELFKSSNKFNTTNIQYNTLTGEAIDALLTADHISLRLLFKLAI